MRKSPKDITNRILLQHMQGMRHALESRISALEKSMIALRKNMFSLEKNGDSLRQDIRNLDEKTDLRFTRIEDALQRLYVRRVEMLQRIERLEDVVGIA